MTNFNQKTIAVTLLMFFSVITPTLTFGAVYGKSTNGYMGAIETLLATGWVGSTYALIGGQPMCIIGSTGPLLIMTTVLYGISKNLGVPFLTFNAWVFVWVFAYTIISGFFDLTRFVRLATRFTDEVFAGLIISIFVMDALGDPFSNSGLIRYFQPTHPMHVEYGLVDENYDYLNTAFLSLILGLGTTFCIFLFRGFRFSSFFCNDLARNSIADFAVILSVAIWTGVSFIFPQIPTEKLKVPDKFEPTFQCCDSSCTTAWPQDCEDQLEPWGARPWFVNLGALNGKGWVPIMAAGPALLAFVLVYLDNGITWHLVAHPSNKLTHGEAYNYDLILSGFFNLVNSFLGLPPLVATTVPCIVHVNSLSVKDRDGNILEVQETRLTHFFSHMILALSLLALNALKLLPLPVLYGVFLFMGLSSLGGIQLWHRFLLFFQQPSKYAETPYTKYMKKSRVHLYTVLQLCFFALVFVVQNIKLIAIAFPLMTFLCIPGRLFFFSRIFEGWEMLLLDGDDIDIDRWIALKEQNNKADAGIAMSSRLDALEEESFDSNDEKV